MKKLMMLGGSKAQLSAIKKAREMGYYVIVCDMYDDVPGKKYAHEFYQVSTKEKEAVLALASSLRINGIVCYAADSGATTVAYVAERLGLPTHPYHSIEILTNKHLFRKFQKENGFHVPNAKGFTSLEEAQAAMDDFKMPVMIKPVDSSGSRGVSKIYSVEELEEKVTLALSFSTSKQIIIEEYIENYGPHIGGDGFSVNGQLVFRSFSNEYFSKNSLNPFVPIMATWPYCMSEQIEEKIHKEIQRLLDLLNMKTGAYNFDIRIDENENVYLIEVTPRNGGDWNPEAIQYVTDVDLIEYTVKAALGEDCSNLEMSNSKGYWATYVINSDQNGVFKRIEIDEEFSRENIIKYELAVKPNEKISALSGSHERVGLMLLTFDSKVEMDEKLKNIDQYVKLKLDKYVMT